ncbi:hypothetical protein [Streptomyces sp. NPDC091217]|uniref:hypothetical protein n=1 Tax=Streptomyces sp. NPDC091217 TaxID=3365975 RepID=UPI0037FCC2A0
MLISDASLPEAVDTSSEVVTLGPPGTDAEAEALKHFRSVRLVESFPAAMADAEQRGSYALVPAGYLQYGRHGGIRDAWVDLHFRWHLRMKVVASWENSTRPMCLAVDPTHVKDLGDVRVIALHPATREFAKATVPQAEFHYFDAKPLALQAALEGRADACICSADLVMASGELQIEETFSPTMLWCLYGPVGEAEPWDGAAPAFDDPEALSS